MEFEWDDAKAAANYRKHGVSFREAATIFDDALVIILHDEEHSVSEDRWIAIGFRIEGDCLW